MNVKILKRVAVIGLPGSGKSTFAINLGKILSIPVHHLDKHRFLKDGTKRDIQEFLDIQKSMIEEESWIIEGCSLSSLELRFARADAVIYFQFPRLLCFWRVFKRCLIKEKILSESGCLDTVNWTLLEYIWNFDRNNKKTIGDLRNKYPHVQLPIFKTAKDADHYLQLLLGN